MKKPTQKKKSYKTKKKALRYNLIRSWLLSHRRVIALAFILIIALFGAWKITATSADTTNLSYEGCFIRGRKWEGFTVCTSTCKDAAAPAVANPVGYMYCSKAVSTTIGESKCNSLGRQFVGTVGCARRWQQTNTKDALQCLDNADTYRDANPYDYCGGALSSNWAWPVPGTRQLGISAWGETNSRGVHKGIDIGISGGGSLNYKVVAAHAGKVTQSYNSGACGQSIVIKARDTPYWQGYQHLSTEGVRVKVGDVVNAGQEIGKIGTAGGSTCGSSLFYHLHFSVENGDWISFYSSPLSNSINPLKVLPD